MVVGLGPGQREYITPQAMAALQEAQVIIGYKTYLAFIRDLLPDKEVISSGMRKEIDRARAALEIALSGRVAAVVSSGDPGVYGMAGIVLEIAGDAVPVEVIPGVTAATSAAAILGAPLMHDFAVISLSDLLTPWETIEKRLTVSAIGDFVIVLYNPRSQGRKQQIEMARSILLQHKDAKTPVGIVQNAKRQGESMVITTLQDMLQEEINMQTTVFIGNSQTRVQNGRMLTPRGYTL
ncbi:MAG TPA: precorrin-3B C(17)-methyltransferase [Syntrophomonadaceae bacterium]|nr:precorrin-3B C(17)-methyltransferase [Syntrophomonadaceae bacterium]